MAADPALEWSPMKRILLIAVLLALALPAVAADKWTRVQSKNFTLVGNASANEIREAAEAMEVFRTAFSKFFNLKEGSTTATTVVVFKTDDAFKPFKPLYQGKPANISGYFQGGQDMNLIALSADMQTPRVIYHEYVHRLMADNLPRLPPWFQEGFAEAFSSITIIGKDKKVQLGRAIAEHVELLNERRFMPLDKLFAVVHGSPEYNEAEKQGLFYAESWAFVHYMMFNGTDRRDQFMKFLDKVNGGTPAPQLFQEVFNTDLATFQKTFEAYIQQRMAWNAFELATPEGLDRSKDMTVRTLSEAESEFYLGDLLLRTNRLPEAETHLAKAVTLDPKLGAAHASMGRLYMRKNNNSEALSALKRATELDPGNYLSHYYYASLLRGRGTSPTEAEWATIRAELQKTIELAPQFIEATEMLASANLARNTDIPQTVQLLIKALQAAPGRDTVILQLAFAVSRTQQREDARPLVQTLLARTTLDLPMRQSAQSLLDYLDRSAVIDSANRTNRATAAAITRTPVDEELPELRRRANSTSAPEATDEEREKPDALASGTAKIRGVLTLLECRNGVTLSLVADGKTVKLHTPAPSSLKFTSFNAAVSGSITCGPMPGGGVAAVIVYRPKEGGDSIGEPLSVEFVEASAPTTQPVVSSIPGTSIAKGMLTKLDCVGTVTLSVVSEGKTLEFRTDSASKVAFLNGPNPDGTVTCGPIAAPGLSVIVVYRPATSGNIAGEPVMVQFQK
jgi:tetratricopeptide (TPR) repeat protein